MKLIGIMSLMKDRDELRKFFKKHEVEIFSETEIAGHTSSTLKEYGWWPTTKDTQTYSVLFFAITSDDKADELMAEMSTIEQDDSAKHPIRAFQVNVEKMI